MNDKNTMNELASITGLSIATISRYFSNKDIVSIKSQLKIERAIDEVGYIKNKFGKVLSTGQSDLIGVIIPNLIYDFYGNVLKEILLYAGINNLQCIVFSSDNNPSKEISYIHELKSYQVKGIINLSNTIDSYQLSKLHPNIIAIEREAKYLKSVVSDNYYGGFLQAKMLHDNGNDILVYCSNQMNDNRTSSNRLKAFVDYCIKQELEYYVIKKDYTKNRELDMQILDDVYQELKTYNFKKCGIAFSNDDHCVDFLNILIRNRESIPAKYELIGFDDSSVATNAIIPITSIKQDKVSLARHAIDLLLEESSTVSEVIVPVTLIKRGSSK